MIIRNCAGGVVFKDDKILILKNDKKEWVIPKGKIIDDSLPPEIAIRRVEYETGVNARIVSAAGETAYEFFSISRNQPVCNKITWYIMESKDEECKINYDEGFSEGGFYPIDEAMELITYSQDKSLVSLSYKKYLDFKQYEASQGLA